AEPRQGARHPGRARTPTTPHRRAAAYVRFPPHSPLPPAARNDPVPVSEPSSAEQRRHVVFSPPLSRPSPPPGFPATTASPVRRRWIDAPYQTSHQSFVSPRDSDRINHFTTGGTRKTRRPKGRGLVRQEVAGAAAGVWFGFPGKS